MILQVRGRTGLTQRDLARSLGVHEHTVQSWEGGTSYPGAARLRALVEVAVRVGAFTPGSEAVEAAALWAAAERVAPRIRSPFDHVWFSDILRRAATSGRPGRVAVATPPAPATERQAGTPRRSWGNAPDVAGFLGRTDERALLRQWVVHDSCRVVGLLGLGGIGKTVLAARLAQDVAPQFEYVYWRSLQDAPNLGEWLAGVLEFLAPGDDPVSGEAAQATLLVERLSRARCLLILDNFETVLDHEDQNGVSSMGSTGYRALLRQFGEVPHQSCLLFTSREAPPELGLMRGELRPVRTITLTGLSVEDGQTLLEGKRLDGDGSAWRALVMGCGGNGLALKVTGDTIRDLFGGEIAAYLEYAASTSGMMFGGVRDVVGAQIDRLPALERELLQWMAVERESVSFGDLAAGFGARFGRGPTLEALEGLRRRSLLEHGERRSSFTLHPVILEYVTGQIIDDAVGEVSTGALDRLLALPLVKATARDYVRRSQERLLAAPVLDRLVANSGSVTMAEQQLVSLLDQLRRCPSVDHGYGPGNLVNFLRLLRGDLRRIDLSGLEIRQAYLQGIAAQDATLVGAHLAEMVLAQAFRNPNAVALSADGVYLVVGTSAGEICLWRVADRTLLATLHGHTGGIRGVALSRDNAVIASASFDGTVRVWDRESGRLLTTMQGHDGFVYAVALSGDGHLAASGGQDGTVRLWETAGGRRLATLPGHAGGVWGVALSGDGRLVASGCVDGAVRLWEAASGRLLRTLTGHIGGAFGVALSRDGQVVASAGLDGTVRLWETERGEPMSVLQGHTGGVRGVALSDDGRLIASCGLDGTVRLWEAGSGLPLANMRGHSGLVYAVVLSGDGRLMASGSFDGTVKLWDAAGGRLLTNLEGFAGGIRSVATSVDGRLLVSGSFDGTVQLWDTEGGRPLRTLRGHTSGIRGVALSHDGQKVASGSFDGSILLWDATSGRLLRTLQVQTGGSWGVTLSGDGRLVASGGYEGTVQLWQAESGRLLKTLEGHAGGVRGVALSTDGRLLASVSEDKTVRLWETDSGRLLATLEGHTGGIWDVSISGDGRLIASGGDDQTVRLWAVDGRRPPMTLRGHTSAVWGVALTDDGRTVASADIEGTVQLWATETGELLATMPRHQGGVWGVALDGAGYQVASPGADGTVLIWAARSGALLHTLRSDRCYERLDITGLTGVTDAQRAAMVALGAVDRRADGEMPG